MTIKIFRNGTLVTFDDESNGIRILRNASLRIDNDRITAMGSDIDIPTDAETIDATGQIITPGFVNTHTHMWQTAFRTLCPDITLAQYFSWTSQNSASTRSFSAEDIHLSCLAGYLEGLNAGTTAFVEHAHNAWDRSVLDAGYRAVEESAARVWWCPPIAKLDGSVFEDTASFLQELRGRNRVGDGLIELGCANDSIDEGGEEEFEQQKKMMRDLDLQAITIHYLGGPWPIGNAGPAAMQKKGLQALDVPVIFSHGGFVTPDDRAALRNHDWSLSITPESEMHYGHGQLTSKLILDQASVGVDTGFTFSADMLTQARLLLQHLRAQNYQEVLNEKLCPRESPMSVDDAFILLTRQGGRAVRRDDIGVLKVGAKADLVCLNGNSPNMLGWTNPVAAVILHANVGDVEHVLVNGQFRKRDGRLILAKNDWPNFSRRFAELARRVQRENATSPELGEKFFDRWEFGTPAIVSMKTATT